MIRQAVESHFEKELQLKLQRRRGIVPAAIKPLTLFFIDKVANYHPADGKFRAVVRAGVRVRPQRRPLPLARHA